MPVKRLTLRAWVLAAACFAQVAVPAVSQEAAGVQSLDAVRARAEQALRAQLGARLMGLQLAARPLDPRLRVADCPQRLEAEAPMPRARQARALVRVSCPAIPWSLNVPVDIRREFDVLVLRKPVARGESVAAADVSVQKRVLPGLDSPYLARVEDLKGRLTRRPLAEGTAIALDALGAALLIHRGQEVTLTASMGGIEVRAPGRALADAAARQRLRVQNLNSLKVVEGVAEAEGVVRVTL